MRKKYAVSVGENTKMNKTSFFFVVVLFFVFVFIFIFDFIFIFVFVFVSVSVFVCLEYVILSFLTQINH